MVAHIKLVFAHIKLVVAHIKLMVAHSLIGYSFYPILGAKHTNNMWINRTYPWCIYIYIYIYIHVQCVYIYEIYTHICSIYIIYIYLEALWMLSIFMVFFTPPKRSMFLLYTQSIAHMFHKCSPHLAILCLVFFQASVTLSVMKYRRSEKRCWYL